MFDPAIDGAHVRGPLAVDQGESSWLCAEVAGTGHTGPRRFAVLAWLHRTGPRLRRLASGLGLLDRNQLPATVRALVPSWLPIVTPVRIESDDRPLLMIVLYDLDKRDEPPLQIEREIEHTSFDESTFSGSTSEVSLHVASDRIIIEAQTPELALRLEARTSKPAVAFGDGGPLLRHGAIEIGYLQRSRLSVHGSIAVGAEHVEVSGAGAHDRHWRHSTTTNLAWLWLHLRLPGDREVNCYVLRDARGVGQEIGRGGWWIDSDSAVHALGTFELAIRGDAYVFDAPALDLRITLAHAVTRPYLRMRAFGDAIEGGIAEGPIRVIEPASSTVEGWLEVFDASTCRVTQGCS